MPHFGLMDAGTMDPAEAALLRARLHWRGGRRRLRQGKTAAGMAALYDALLHGLSWQIMSHPTGLGATAGELENEEYLLAWAEQAGLFASPEDSQRLRTLVETALGGEISPAEQEWLVAELARVLTMIGLLPFPEASLPPEDPATD